MGTDLSKHLEANLAVDISAGLAGTGLPSTPAAVLAGGRLHMRATDVVLNGSDVSSWVNLLTDYSATYYGNQATPASQPAYTTALAGANDQPAVDFASSAWMDLVGIETLLSGEDTPFTVHLCTNKASGSGKWFGAQDSGSTSRRCEAGIASLSHKFYRRTSAGDTVNLTGDSAAYGTRGYSLSFTGTTVTLWDSAVRDSVIDDATADTANNVTFTDAVLGASYASGVLTDYFNANMMELVISNTAHDDAEAAAWHAYCVARYGAAE